MKVGLKLFVSLFMLGTVSVIVPITLTSCEGEKNPEHNDDSHHDEIPQPDPGHNPTPPQPNPEPVSEDFACVINGITYDSERTRIENFLNDSENIVEPDITGINCDYEENETVDFLIEPAMGGYGTGNALTTYNQNAKYLIYNKNFLKLFRNSFMQCALKMVYNNHPITSVTTGENATTTMKSLTLNYILNENKLDIDFILEFWDTTRNGPNDEYTGNFNTYSFEYTLLYSETNISCNCVQKNNGEDQNSDSYCWNLTPIDICSIFTDGEYFGILKHETVGLVTHYISLMPIKQAYIANNDWVSIKALFPLPLPLTPDG